MPVVKFALAMAGLNQESSSCRIQALFCALGMAMLFLKTPSSPLHIASLSNIKYC